MEKLRGIVRVVFATFFVVVGVLHFAKPDSFMAIMPKALPAHLLLVYLSGFFEIAGGVGLLIPKTRRAASFGIIALMVAVFPANINQAINHVQIPGLPPQPEFMLWVRLLFQPVYMLIAWWVGKPAAEGK